MTYEWFEIKLGLIEETPNEQSTRPMVPIT